MQGTDGPSGTSRPVPGGRWWLHHSAQTTGVKELAAPAVNGNTVRCRWGWQKRPSVTAYYLKPHGKKVLSACFTHCTREFWGSPNHFRADKHHVCYNWGQANPFPQPGPCLYHPIPLMFSVLTSGLCQHLLAISLAPYHWSGVIRWLMSIHQSVVSPRNHWPEQLNIIDPGCMPSGPF